MTDGRNLQALFAAHFNACGQRIEKLARSLLKTEIFFPLTMQNIDALNEQQEESIDALILRYGQCVSMMQDQLFRGIALLEHEDINDKSNRDKTLLMEKLGAIKSADDFGVAAILRNKFAHHYPEEAKERIERLNLVIEETKFVLDSFQDLSAFVTRKNYANTAH